MPADRLSLQQAVVRSGCVGGLAEAGGQGAQDGNELGRVEDLEVEALEGDVQGEFFGSLAADRLFRRPGMGWNSCWPAGLRSSTPTWPRCSTSCPGTTRRARRPGSHRQVMPAAGSVAFRWSETRARCNRIASIARAGSRARSAVTSSW
jgi:hypothetical protein